MARSLDEIVLKDIDRRKFVKGAMVATAATALGASFVGCTSAKEEDETLAEVEGVYSPVDNEEGGEWISAACWHNCGGKCVNKVYMKDGAVVRMKTDDTHEDSWEWLQQRGCMRGRAQQQQCFGADRLKYPMKRKHWEPLTGGDKSLRGRDEWVRISWDEAFELVAAELKNVYDNYGPRSVFSAGDQEARVGVDRVINYMGGAINKTDSRSFGTYCQDISMLGIPYSWNMNAVNDRLDYKNAEYIVFYCHNIAHLATGQPMYIFYRLKEMGVKFVAVSTTYNETAQALDAKWIRVNGGTDNAFMLAVAYEMIKLDEEKGNVIDWDMLHNFTVGFDADHMPDDAKLDENFKDYLLGEYDGIPKTAEWATEICGTPVEDIRWYAELMGKENKVTLHHGYGFTRSMGSEDCPQLLSTIAFMGGHYGKPGHGCGGSHSQNSATGGPRLVKAGPAGLPKLDNPIDEMLLAPTIWKSILDKKHRYIGNIRVTDGFRPYEDRDIDIRLIYSGGIGLLQGTPDIMNGVRAWRSVDFVFSCAYCLNPQAAYADIVLPATTHWEIPGEIIESNKEAIIVCSQVTEPLFEAKTDQDIGIGICEALGIDPDEVYPISRKQQFFNTLAGATTVNSSGEEVTLATITQNDIDEWECDGEPQEGVIALGDLIEQGVYTVKRSEGDQGTYLAYKEYLDDIENNPLPSASGKFEIYCQRKADTFNATGLADYEVKPYPSYYYSVVGYERCFENWPDKSVKAKYPYVAANDHYFRRSHTTLDNLPWLRETWPNPVFINAHDAAEKGIVTGDPVVVFNDYGKIVRTASVLETMSPGYLSIPHGSWLNLDENEEYDLGGADGVIQGPVTCSTGASGYNNHNVDFEKYSGGPLTPDCELPERIIDL